MLELLVQHGADIKAAAFDGRTPCGKQLTVFDGQFTRVIDLMMMMMKLPILP